MTKDPVCGMDVPDNAPLKSEFGGKTYRFCSAGCKERFDRQPERYAERVPVGQQRR